MKKTTTTQNSNKYLINWIGGKRLLRKTIAEHIPTDIGNYIEVFGGGAWVLFYKDFWAKNEVYNDLDERLYNLFNIVKWHPLELINCYKYMLTNRRLFKQALSDAGATDIQKACIFLYLITKSFGGKGTHFGYSIKGESSGSKSHKNTLNRINQIADRLDKVTIENLDFEALIDKYDYENAFFYLDPPYTKGAGYKVTSCKSFEHLRLLECLKKVKGRWLLSYNDDDYIRELYCDYEIVDIARKNTLNNKSRSLYKEILIKNF